MLYSKGRHTKRKSITYERKAKNGHETPEFLSWYKTHSYKERNQIIHSERPWISGTCLTSSDSNYAFEKPPKKAISGADFLNGLFTSNWKWDIFVLINLVNASGAQNIITHSSSSYQYVWVSIRRRRRKYDGIIRPEMGGLIGLYAIAWKIAV